MSDLLSEGQVEIIDIVICMHYDVVSAFARRCVLTQLTVRNVDDGLHATLKREAKRRGISVNRLVLQLIAEGVGLSPRQHSPIEHNDLDSLAGTWDKEQSEEFAQFYEFQRDIDEEMWK